MDIHAAEVADILGMPVNRVVPNATQGGIPLAYHLDEDGRAVWNREEVLLLARRRQQQAGQFDVVGRDSQPEGRRVGVGMKGSSAIPARPPRHPARW